MSLNSSTYTLTAEMSAWFRPEWFSLHNPNNSGTPVRIGLPGGVVMADGTIYFISDTHLGDGTGADRFRYPAQLMALLQQIDAEQGAELVLLGDIFELWAGSLEESLIHHAPVFELLGRIATTHPVTYVVGNHDCLPWYYFVGQGTGNIRVAERFTTPDGTLVAIHGHQYDPFNQVKVTDEGNVKTPWVRKLAGMIGVISRLGGQKTGDAVDNIKEALFEAVSSLPNLLPNFDTQSKAQMGAMLTHVQTVLERESPGERGYPLDEVMYDQAARSLMRDGAQFVLMGHTHRPVVQRWGRHVYVNTGSWAWDRFPPTYARFAGRRLELLDANTNQPYA